MERSLTARTAGHRPARCQFTACQSAGPATRTSVWRPDERGVGHNNAGATRAGRCSPGTGRSQQCTSRRGIAAWRVSSGRDAARHAVRAGGPLLRSPGAGVSASGSSRRGKSDVCSPGGAYFRKAWLAGADLRHAVCDNATNLEKVTLADKKWGCVLLADVLWDDCNLAVIDWRYVIPLGDEARARALPLHDGYVRSFKEKHNYLDTYQSAVRAYRQLANAMRAQGMNEEAVPFAYRAQKLQRKVLWRQAVWGDVEVDLLQAERQKGLWERVWELRRRTLKFGGFFFSCFLDVLSGYGHKPGRSLLIYLLTIAVFATCYLVLGRLAPLEALIFSVTAFHGRGFFPGPFALSNPVTALAALEAVVGLFIEISFIATFTQRFFGR